MITNKTDDHFKKQNVIGTINHWYFKNCHNGIIALRFQGLFYDDTLTATLKPTLAEMSLEVIH